MPIFEYKCADCGSKFDFLHKSISNQEKVKCPSCGSGKNEKLLSVFSSSNSSSSDFVPSCSDGSCGMPAVTSMGGCANGMCGLN